MTDATVLIDQAPLHKVCRVDNDDSFPIEGDGPTPLCGQRIAISIRFLEREAFPSQETGQKPASIQGGGRTGVDLDIPEKHKLSLVQLCAQPVAPYRIARHQRSGRAS